MNHVIRHIHDPDLSFPGNVAYVFAKLAHIRKGAHVDTSSRAVLEHLLKFVRPLRGHGAVQCHGLNEKKQVAPGIKEHYVRQLTKLRSHPQRSL